MSCKNCEENSIRGAYYRWKTANVEIVACKEHWLEIREALNTASKHKKCIKCGALFICLESEKCWCASFPKIKKGHGGDCYCPKCLQELTNEKKRHIARKI